MALKTPQVRIQLEQDGTTDVLELDVQTDNRDMIQWDVTRARRDWPKGQEAPALWLTFLAWHALHRTGGTALQLDAFLASCIDVSSIDRAGDKLPPNATAEEVSQAWDVDPTRPAPVTD